VIAVTADVVNDYLSRHAKVIVFAFFTYVALC